MNTNLFDVSGRVAVVTGGYGILGASMAEYLVTQGAQVVVLGRSSVKGVPLAERIGAFFVQADVTSTSELEAACKQVEERYGRIDILINAAGGNMPGATIADDKSLFDLSVEDTEQVMQLNLMGTIKPTLVFGASMARAGRGSIINVSSMSAIRVISRVAGYSFSKAAIDSFTRWAAVDLAHKFGEGVRVNAIAPGFFLTEQNRTLLTNADGSPTPRAEKVLRQTPYGRMGRADELHGAVHFLASEASGFVTGVVLPVDGGGSIYSGV